MKKLLYLSAAVLFVIGCTNSSTDEGTTDTTTTGNDVVQTETLQEEYDETVGTGKYNETNFTVSPTVDAELAKKGDAIYGAKCQSCHKTTDERLVGPGFKGVSERRTPVWVMNFLTNTDEMIDVDPAMQEELEICMVRMPDQALTETDAHAFVEFFRQLDGVK